MRAAQAGDSRVLLLSEAGGDLGVVGAVPNVGLAAERPVRGHHPGRDPRPGPGHVRRRALRAFRRGGVPARRSGRRRASRPPPASCASCSRRSPACVAAAACPRSCARSASRARARRRRHRLERGRARAPGGRAARRVVEDRRRVRWQPSGPRPTSPSCRSPRRSVPTSPRAWTSSSAEYLLRQQLAAIRKELGEGDDDVIEQYRTKLAETGLGDKAYTTVDKEIDRLERTSQQSPEHAWIRTWLDRVFELPWNVRTDDQLDLAAARAIARRRPLRPRRREGPHRRVPRRPQAPPRPHPRGGEGSASDEPQEGSGRSEPSPAHRPAREAPATSRRRGAGEAQRSPVPDHSAREAPATSRTEGAAEASEASGGQSPTVRTVR